MADVSFKLVLDVEAKLVLNEDECRALDALIGYGTDSFLKVFYEKLGAHYMRPHENGLRSLFAKFAEVSGPAMRLADETRKAIKAGKEPKPLPSPPLAETKGE